MLAANEVRIDPAAPGLKGLRRAALSRLAGSPFGYRLFQALGRCYGVEEAAVRGEFGVVAGPLDDAAVLRAYAINGFWARAANQFFCDFFDRAGGGTYLDIGANLGLTTIPVAQNARVACHAFEPAPGNFKYLARNVAANCPHGNVALFNLALFDCHTTVEMSLAPHNSGDARVRDAVVTRGGQPLPLVSVPAERLDDVLDVETLARPIAAKIVTQGAEARVLAGGQRVLGTADVMVLEFDPALIREIDYGIDLTTDFLAAHFTSAAPLRGPDFERGGVRHPLVWRPMRDMIAEMRDMMTRVAAPGADYYYIYVRQ